MIHTSYQKLAQQKIESLKKLRDLDKIESSFKNKNEKQYFQNYKQMIQDELISLCEEIIEIVDKLLSLKDNDIEVKVFYLQIKGDYYTIIAEQNDETKIRNEAAQQAFQYYSQGYELSQQLPQDNLTRASLGTNFSIFYYNILKDVEKACKLGKQTFDDSISTIEQLGEDLYYDRKSIIQSQLRDCLTQWVLENYGEDYEEQLYQN